MVPENDGAALELPKVSRPTQRALSSHIQFTCFQKTDSSSNK